jgi:D-serine deaminase-like pyridoxal phosphate-dependent protein
MAPVDKGEAVVGRDLFTVALPAAVVMRDALEHNIATMARYCRDHDLILAPHGKTTMFPPIVRRQLAAGAWAMTAATAWQATALADMGAPRIILANQVVDRGSLRLLDELLARPGMEVLVFVDSAAAYEALVSGVAPARHPRLSALLELGFDGGRAGVRTSSAGVDLAQKIAAGPVRLAGVASFEGILDGGDLATTLGLVDRLMERVASLARSVQDLTGLEQPIVTVGGSAYFDRAAAVLAPALAGTPYRIVLRSGCYASHDAGVCHEQSPFGARPRAPYQLTDALQLWAPVLSRPEPTLVIAGLGKRDAATDHGLPVPRFVRSGGVLGPVDATVTMVNDQHAYLAVPADSPVKVGDALGFAISHPCTTFDKWRAISVVDASYTVLEVGTTRF